MSKLNCRVEDGYYPGMLEITGYDFRIAVVTSATDLSFQDGIKRKDQAHLIASAPDLYRALDLCLEVLMFSEGGEPLSFRTAIVEAKQALAKARGEL